MNNDQTETNETREQLKQAILKQRDIEGDLAVQKMLVEMLKEKFKEAMKL